MKLYLARHGVTTGNTEHRGQGGGSNPSLSELGEKQADCLADRLSSEDIRSVYTSPLDRARQTAWRIANKHQYADYVIFPEFKEIDFGLFEGMTNSEVYKKYRDLLVTRKEDKFNFKGYEGESISDVYDRAVPQLESILSFKEDCVIVSHGMVTRTLLMRLLGREYEEVGIPTNAALYAFNVDSEVEIEAYNCTKHLDFVSEEEIDL